MSRRVKCNCYSGYVFVPCRECKGQGRQTQPFFKTSAQSKVPCKVCNGKGNVKQPCRRGCSAGYFVVDIDGPKVAVAGEG